MNFIFKTLFLNILVLLILSGCSNKEVENSIDYDTQQKNSKEALKEL